MSARRNLRVEVPPIKLTAEYENAAGWTRRTTFFPMPTTSNSRLSSNSSPHPLMRQVSSPSLGSRHPVARDLLKFALSDQAQSTIVEVGFIDQSVDLQADIEQRQFLDTVEISGPFLPGKDIPAAGRAGLTSTLASARRSSCASTAAAPISTRAPSRTWRASPATSARPLPRLARCPRQALPDRRLRGQRRQLGQQ